MTIYFSLVIACVFLLSQQCHSMLDSCRTMAEVGMESARDEYKSVMKERMGAVERANENLDPESRPKSGPTTTEETSVTNRSLKEGNVRSGFDIIPATVSPEDICRDFENYMCCIKKLQKRCGDIAEDAMLETRRTKNGMTRKLTEAQCTVTPLSDTAGDCQCPYHTETTCVKSEEDTIKNYQKIFDRSLMNVGIASDTPDRTKLCQAVTGLACCLKKIEANNCSDIETLAANIIMRSSKGAKHAMEKSRDRSSNINSQSREDTDQQICGLTLSNPLTGIDPSSCTCPTEALAGDAAVTCNNAFFLIESFEECAGQTSALQTLINHQSPTEQIVKDALKEYCKTTVPGVIRCMLEKYGNCNTEAKVTGYADNYRARLCDGDVTDTQYTLLAGEILAALKTTKAECKVSISPSIKRCHKILSLDNRKLHMHIAKKTFDKIMPLFQKMTKTFLTCARNVVRKTCGTEETRGIMTLLRAGVFFGVDLSNETATDETARLNTKSKQRSSLTYYAGGHTKGSDKTWRACEYPLGTNVLLSNRYISVEGENDKVQEDLDFTMFTKITITFKQLGDVKLEILASDFDNQVETLTTSGVSSLDGKVTFKKIKDGLLRITYKEAAFLVTLGVWKDWISLVLTRTAKNVIDLDSSGKMVVGCLAGIDISTTDGGRRKRSTATECEEACGSGEVSSQCVHNCQALNDTSIGSTVGQMTYANNDATNLDDTMAPEAAAVMLTFSPTLILGFILSLILHLY